MITKSLEKLLSEIEKQPYLERRTKYENNFLYLVEKLRIPHYNLYVQYICRYNDIKNAKHV